MRLRLFNRVRRSGGLDSGSSRSRGPGGEVPGRHRQPGRGVRDLWQDRSERHQAGPVPPRDLEREQPSADPLPVRKPLTGPFPRRDAAAASPQGDGPGRFLGGGETGPVPRRETTGLLPRGEARGELPRREARGELPRREARTRLPGGDVPRDDQSEVQVGGARARVRPWFPSPVRERPAAGDTRDRLAAGDTRDRPAIGGPRDRSAAGATRARLDAGRKNSPGRETRARRQILEGWRAGQGREKALV
jgi:hypothetical protein